MIISLIVAVAENGVIGRDGGMPWRMSTDLKRFRSLTMGKPVIMGRKTFESLGKPLEGRDNIVVTRQAGWAGEGALVATDINAAFTTALSAAQERQVDEIVVIGGAQIYAAAMPRVTRIYLSKIHGAPEGDTTLPDLDSEVWQQKSTETVAAGPRDDYDHTFIVYERVGPATC